MKIPVTSLIEYDTVETDSYGVVNYRCDGFNCLDKEECPIGNNPTTCKCISALVCKMTVIERGVIFPTC
jgi:hypothetical protein